MSLGMLFKQTSSEVNFCYCGFSEGYYLRAILLGSTFVTEPLVWVKESILQVGDIGGGDECP